tara:strand:- start:16 stop:354 length:339 start_codon:yes stop_codon:yes gene_type:complete
MKKWILTIVIFVLIYLIFGIGQTFFFGDYNFFEEYSQHSKKDAIFVSLAWPAFFILIGAFGGILGIIIAGIVVLGILGFFFWIPYLIVKKIFKKKEIIQSSFNRNNLKSKKL